MNILVEKIQNELDIKKNKQKDDIFFTKQKSAIELGEIEHNAKETIAKKVTYS